ncbi:hypothetical protein JHK82_033408 [Glycine max]|nr:hypothetical protein JHK85_034131 [Glycine max]KAG5118988.1 hypothetical protein JHK82_033408 [Glycine max]KAG5139983.1 hypothetical protein JHK84_033751 [Glycine max]
MPSSSTMPLLSDPPFLCAHEAAIAGLLDVEPHHMLEKDYLRRCRDHSVNITTCLDAVNWILKVHAYHEFSPVTAFLSVNYFDRFLS